MLRSKPRSPYCGLTVVLSNPSRLDKADLLTGNAGYFFSERCLRPDFNRYQCDIRVKEDKEPLLPNTKAVLLLGESAAQTWLNNTGNTLNEIRGSHYIINGIPHIASYLPQNCVDFKDFESIHNPLSDHYADPDYDSDDDDNGVDDKRRHGNTSWRNFGFWLMKDAEKAKHILLHGLPEVKEPEYIIYPNSDTLISTLRSTKDSVMFFDMETDIELNMICFSFSFNSERIYVAPCLLPDYSWAYSSLPEIYRALAIAVRDNIVVAHNGCNFDYFVLAYKYRIAIRKVYDTLVAQHRCYPEQEKSLGHCTSMWTWEQFHKDEGDIPYTTMLNAKQTWAYCGKDVFTMSLVYDAQIKHAKRIPGLMASINQANESIRPYLITSMQGIRYNQDALNALLLDNDKRMNHYLKWLDYLIGEDTLKVIRGKGKSSMPSSNPQCCKYFHDLLGYPVVGKGKEKKDGTRSPSLGKLNMFKLRLKQDNPVINIVLTYRELGKESGAIKFTPWKEDKNDNTANR